MLKNLLPDLQQLFPTILLTATTGKAALRLAELTKEGTSTLHKVLYEPPDDSSSAPKFDALQAAPAGGLVVVDEASMITPDVWKDLKKWMKLGTRVLLVGDGFQLPPVLSDSKREEDFNIFALVPGPRLDEVMRNGDDILDAATLLRVERRLLREEHGTYRWRRAALSQVLGEWLEQPKDHMLITWRNKIRMSMNRVVRKARGLESGFPTPGEPLVLRRNGRGFLNGQIVTATEESKGGPRFGKVSTSWVKVEIEGESKPRLLFASCSGRDELMDGVMPMMDGDEWKTYLMEKRKYEWGWAKERGLDEVPRMDPLPITWGYALTAHLAQGGEADRVTVYLDPWDVSSKPFLKDSLLPDGTTVPFWVRWLYSSITRGKKRVDIVIGV